LAARLSDHYGVAVPLRMVFEAPTVAAQAQRLEAETLTPQQPIARRAEGMVRLPLSPAQERLWFLWRLAPEDTAYVIAGAVRLTGRLDVARLRR
ncbi:phosphopantetheine-binding protein, partial [Acinetobacter baumannii]